MNSKIKKLPTTNYKLQTDKIYYFDYAAATPLDQEVKKVINSFEEDFWANPSSSHLLGWLAKEAIESSREKVAKILNTKIDEIIFTGSGTEANNLAILGVARRFKIQDSRFKIQEFQKSKIQLHPTPYTLHPTIYHIITSTIEHSSVLGACYQLEKEGFLVTYLKPDQGGFIDPMAIKNALRPETILVSIMYVNNEIGTIQPIQEIAKVIDDFRRSKSNQSLDVISSQSERSKISRSLQLLEMTKGWDMAEKTPFFHSDACQASGFLDLNTKKLGVDLMTLNSSKIYGPKGAGVLYKKSQIELEPLVYGSDQRGGLKNGSAVIGLAKALEIAQKNKEKESKRLTGLRDYLIKRILKEIPGTILNGPIPVILRRSPRTTDEGSCQLNNDNSKDSSHSLRMTNGVISGIHRIPNNINISFAGIDGQTLATFLEKYKIYLSTTSACYSGSQSSYVVKEISNQERAQSAIRITLGSLTKRSDLDFLIEKLKIVLKTLKK